MRNIAIGLASVLVIGLGASCSSMKSSNESKTEAITTTPTTKSSYALNFNAIGNEPGWNVKVSESQITYRSMNMEDKLVFTDLKMDRIMDVAGLAYFGMNDKGQTIRIQILKEKCSDTMSDKDWPFSVLVNLVSDGKAEDMRGCGEYILDPRLNEKWILKELGGSAVIAKNAEKKPMILFNTEKQIVQANMGCNGIGGAYELMENTIYFDDRFMSTQMYCEDVMELEGQFTELFMGKSLKYHFESDVLIFTNFNNEVVAKFGK